MRVLLPCAMRRGAVRSGGIFSMHAQAGNLLTCSKDAAVAYSVVTTSGIKRLHYFDSLHVQVQVGRLVPTHPPAT